MKLIQFVRKALALIAIWIPPLLLGWWGYTYANACINVLTSATGPVVYRQASSGGMLTLSATALQFDPNRNFLHLQNVVALRPDSTALCKATSVTIQNVLPENLFGSHKSMVVELTGVTGTLKRLKNGLLELREFLPKQTTEAGKIPFSVRLINGQRMPARVRVVDLEGPTAWEGVTRVSRFNLEGVGPRWLATGVVTLEGAGSASAEVRNDPDHGLSVDGLAGHLNLVALATHVLASVGSEEAAINEEKSLQTLRGFTARSLTVNGPVHVFLPKSGPITFGASVSADAQGLAYKNEFQAAEAHFQGFFTNEGLRGILKASGEGTSVQYVGALSWGKSTVLGGSLIAHVQQKTDAPSFLKRFLPTNAGFKNADFSGWVSYSGAGNIVITGNGSVTEADYSKQVLQNPRFQINASNKVVTINLVSGSWGGSPIQGALNFLPRTHGLDGLLRTGELDIATVAKAAGVRNVSGTAQAQALITGTSLAPVVTLRAKGDMRTFQRGRNFNLGRVVAAADIANGKFAIERLSFQGPDGVATAKGVWDQKTGSIDFDVVGQGVPLAILSANLKGQAAFKGKIEGTARNPQGTGKLEVYGATFSHQQAPLILADVSVNERTLHATNVQAYRNASKATGEVSLDLKTHALRGTGQANDIRLSDVLGPQVAGTVRVFHAALGGTLEHVVMHGNVDGENIVAESVEVDKVAGEFDLNGDQFNMLSLIATLDKGSATASGTYNLKTQTGAASGTVKGLSMADFAGTLPANTSPVGTLDADFSTQFGAGFATLAHVTGSVQNAGLNGTAIGSGPFSITGSGPQWSGALTLSSGAQQLVINDANYDQRTKTAQGKLDAKNLSLKALASAAIPYIAPESASSEQKSKAVTVLPDQVAQDLYTLNGTLNASIAVSGTKSQANIGSANISLSGLQIGGQAGGTIQTRAKLADGVWNISSFDWVGGPGVVSLSGTLADKGPMNLKGSAMNLSPQWLAIFAPDLQRLPGRAEVSFLATGPTKSPIINANIDYADGLPSDKNRNEIKVAATVKDGSINAIGTYLSEGLSGPITAELPFRYPLSIPSNGPISAEIGLPDTPLAGFATVLPWLDVTRTNGHISGNITLKGTTNKFTVLGKANMAADVLAAKSYQTTLNKVDATANFNGTTLEINASAKGSKGGDVKFSNGEMTLNNMSDLISGPADELLANTVKGTLAVNALRVTERGSDPIDAVFNGRLALDRTLHYPLVKGNLSVVSGSVSVPAAPAVSPENLRPVIDPTFDVALSIPNPINVKAGVGQFQMSGDGMLGGSFALINLDMQLVVDAGTVRLPNARIKIDPGGTVHLLYRSDPYGQPTESAEVDLAGSTALTANPYGNVIQRYDVQLQMRGDLLSQAGMNISAQADPPDLGQDKILMMLGQGGLFLQQAAGSEVYRPEQQLQQAAFTALPLLFDPFTQQVANGLGLDYFDFEYNPFEGISVTGAKALGKNLVVSARRQISPPLPGQPVDWDFRISYRLPFKSTLRNLNLSVGADQLNPWRLGLEYGWRF